MKELTDKTVIAKLMESAKAKNDADTVKTWAHKKGYIHALSLYGVLTEQTERRSEYRRIEVLSNVFWTGEIVERLYRFFLKVKPKQTYTIWVYDRDRKSVALAGAWD